MADHETGVGLSPEQMAESEALERRVQAQVEMGRQGMKKYGRALRALAKNIDPADLAKELAEEPHMPRDAYDVLKRFWEIQDAHDYTALNDLFADDARLVDPIYGVFEGKAAIAGFMAKMNEEMGKQGITFSLVDLAGEGETAWAQWVAHTPRGERHGCGLYRVRDGKMTYYRDYILG